MNKFQIFKLNFSRDMAKMHYLVTNFQKSPSARDSPPFNLDFGDMKLRDLPKLCFQTDYDEIELSKNQLWRYFSEAIEIRHHTRFFHFWAPPNQDLWLHCLKLKLLAYPLTNHREVVMQRQLSRFHVFFCQSHNLVYLLY